MLQFQFVPLQNESTEDVPIFSGYGKLTLTLNNQNIWDNIEEYWDGFLYHLAKNWNYLLKEDKLPIINNFSSSFLNEAMHDLRKMNLSKNDFIREEIKIFSFNDRHNLAAGMSEIHLTPVFMIYENKNIRIIAESIDVYLSVKEVKNILNDIGDTISKFINPKSERGEIILKAWNNKKKFSIN